MKKIFLISISILFTLLFSSHVHSAPCDDFTGDQSLKSLVTDCVESTGQLTVQGGDVSVGGGTNAIINTLIGNLGILLSIGAVIMVVYSGFLMTLSGGNDEKVKKGKDLLKWTLVGYIALLTAGGIVSFVISLIYNIASS